MQRRRNKVKDKPLPDPRREYLDAESSDETERPEEEEDLEEERPIYREYELNELIQCVKDMTTLSGLKDSDWTWRCDMDIQEFFQNPSIPVLCVYHVDGDLTTEFSFPTLPVHELTYFVRQPNEILYPENFRERILFGSLNDRVESHILRVIQDVLAPIFFTIETWPDSILPLLPCVVSQYLLLHFRQTIQLIRATNAESFAWQ
ncbi:dynein axonemal heavy chain 2-like [Cataglyphis hispanica]|uniref:dynein axonemal heavy chain 2-like n=1 Tax=Cataglyphis hispanica TaxID=1086592 RepID=UPI0021801E56|nr:dynein axonemal heavy chain 2-like [Cataglyphis hispanica]